MSGTNLQPRKQGKWDYLILTMLLFLAYLPVTSFSLAIKNDFFRAYYPVRHFLSLSVSQGAFPLWNPYLNYGFPIYGDMSESYWNPGTWIIASTWGYNAWSFTLEQILYLLCAAAGMYKLSGLWIKSRYLKMICAVSYCCCGFMVGDLQHFNWISGAGLMPFCAYAFFSFLLNGQRFNGILSVFLFSWYVTSVHPGMIIGAVYFFGVSGIYYMSTGSHPKFKIGGRILVIAAGTAITCAGMAMGYIEILPLADRSVPVNIFAHREGTTGLTSWISFLLPFASNPSSTLFSNDIALRNCYMGLFLFATACTALVLPPKGIARFLFFSGIGFILLSSPLVFPFYKYLPLIRFVRLNAEFRIFGLFSMILASGIQAEKLLSANSILLKKTLYLFLMFMIALVTFAALRLFIADSSIFFRPLGHIPEMNADSLKPRLHSVTIPDALLIQGLIQVILLVLFIRGVRLQNARLIFICVCADLILATNMNLPYTGMGKTTVSEIQAMINREQRGMIDPSLRNENEILPSYYATDAFIGNWAYYGREIAIEKEMYYPLVLDDTKKYFMNPDRQALMNRPFAFFRSGPVTAEKKISLEKFAFSSMSFSTSSLNVDTLIVKQNAVPGWAAKVDGVPVAPMKAYGALTAVPLPAGNHEVSLAFFKPWVKPLFWCQMFFMGSMLAWLGWHTWRRKGT